ncbi:unnamed protein product, partial [Ectocarpus sp. 12 AP-2014]
GCHPPLFSGSRRSSSIESYPQCSQPTFIAPAGRNAALQAVMTIIVSGRCSVSCCGRCTMFLLVGVCWLSVVSTTPLACSKLHRKPSSPGTSQYVLPLCLTPSKSRREAGQRETR